MKILVLDALALHLGYVGFYGNDWVATPNLDRLAAEGIVFDNHFVEQPELASSNTAAETPAWWRSLENQGISLIGQSVGELDGYSEKIADALDRLAAVDDGMAWIAGPSLAPPWQL